MRPLSNRLPHQSAGWAAAADLLLLPEAEYAALLRHTATASTTSRRSWRCSAKPGRNMIRRARRRRSSRTTKVG